MTTIPAVSRNLSELADEIGFAPAVLLAGAYGGVNLYIPRTMHKTHAIALLFQAGGVGYGPAMALSEMYPDTTLAVPKLYAYERLRQCAEANNLVASGVPEHEAARALGMPLKTFRKRLSEAREIGISARKLRDRRRLTRFHRQLSLL